MQGSVCSTGHLNFGKAAPKYDYNPTDTDQSIPKWILLLIDGDRLREINLRTHKVRTIFQSPNLSAVYLLKAIEDAPEDGKKKTAIQIVLRLTDRIILMDRATGEKQEYLLPKSMQKQRLSAYAPGGGQLLLVSQDHGGGSKDRKQVKLVRFSHDGQITREKEISLRWPGQSVPEPAQMAMAGLVAPIPLGWMVGGGIMGPLAMVQENKVPSYSAGLQKTIARG